MDLAGITRAAKQDLLDPWFRTDQPPVLLAAGRLHPQKDYPTLLRAFARVRSDREVRLVILGEGDERPRLEALTRKLALTDHVRLPGYQKNPYAYMARAAAFILSSRWEGFPNVLLEALACGCSVISTDCPNGPSELLAGGHFGRLVPVGDEVALERAILASLDAPPDKMRQRRRAEEFAVDTIAEEYLQLVA